MSKILIVDDSALVCDWVAQALATFRIASTSCTSPFGIARRVVEEAPDLVLLDVNMPGLSGKSVCRILKKADPKLKVVLFSAMDPDSLRAAATESGADGFVVKTQRPATLAMAINAHLNPGATRCRA